MSEEQYSITIDGPAGAGKSTIAKKIAEILDIEYIDTGAMFRAFTLKLLNEELLDSEKSKIITLLDDTSIDFKNNNIYLDGKEVNDEIRDNKISKNVSNIAKIEEVRDKMLKRQRKMSSMKSVIMDGRDIGTVVLPDADYKFFLTATVEERARRRYLELSNKNHKVKLEDIIEEIKLRDNIDSTRKIAPLRKADDAILIDTTNMNIDETVDKIISYIK